MITILRKRNYPWDKTFENIRSRCENPKNPSYRYYGGNGIRCLISKKDLLQTYLRDKAWLLKKPSIDRINPKLNYDLSNIRWIEHSDNSRSRNGYDINALKGIIQIGPRLPADLYKQFHVRCVEKGVSISQQIENLVRSWVKKETKCKSMAKS